MIKILIDTEMYPEFLHWLESTFDPDDMDIPSDCDCIYKKKLNALKHLLESMFLGIEVSKNPIDENLVRLFKIILPHCSVDTVNLESLASDKNTIVLTIE